MASRIPSPVSGPVCSICQGGFTKPVVLPCPSKQTAPHKFCLDCIAGWLGSGRAKANLCPLCEAPILQSHTVTKLTLTEALARFFGIQSASASSDIEIVPCPENSENQATEEDLEALIRSDSVNNHQYTVVDAAIAVFIIGMGAVLSVLASVCQSRRFTKNAPIQILASTARIPLTIFLLAPLIKLQRSRGINPHPFQSIFLLVSLFATPHVWTYLNPEELARVSFLALTRLER